MSKLMWIAGILLMAVGVALGLMVFVSTAAIIAWGIDLHVAVTLLIGGILSLGLGSVISGLETLRIVPATVAAPLEAAALPTPIPEFGRRNIEPAATAAAIGATEAIEVSEPVKETIEALENARQKIEQAFEPKTEEDAAENAEEPAEVPAIEEPAAPEEPAEAEVVDEEVAAEGQLYVVEERLIRTRPARILSDGTVEAETEEGWMRFENLEHLDEYLDAMSPSK